VNQAEYVLDDLLGVLCLASARLSCAKNRLVFIVLKHVTVPVTRKRVEQ
jgi:hypothetical protein